MRNANISLTNTHKTGLALGGLLGTVRQPPAWLTVMCVILFFCLWVPLPKKGRLSSLFSWLANMCVCARTIHTHPHNSTHPHTHAHRGFVCVVCVGCVWNFIISFISFFALLYFKLFAWLEGVAINVLCVCACECMRVCICVYVCVFQILFQLLCCLLMCNLHLPSALWQQGGKNLIKLGKCSACDSC